MIAVELLADRQPVGRPLLDPERLVRLEAGDADHEEFVEVVGRDRQEAHALEQRVLGVARLLEHAAVEGQPAQLAVEVARLRLRRFGGRASDRALNGDVHQLAGLGMDAVELAHFMSLN